MNFNMNPTTGGSAFTSAFGGQGNNNNSSGGAFAGTPGVNAFNNTSNAFGGGAGAGAGGGANNNPSRNVFAGTSGGASVFSNTGSASGGGFGGNNGASAFNNNNAANNNTSQGIPFNDGGGGFNSGGGRGGFNTYNQSAQGQGQYGGAGDGRGRGRGNISYRGGRGGGNRGSPNMTYVAPGLLTSHSQQQQQQPQQQHQPHGRSNLSSVFTAGSPGGSGEFDSAFATTGTNHGGRGGYPGSPRGRGRGGASGVPGQFRSMQWRPDAGSQSQGSNESSMAMDSASDTTSDASSSAFSTSSVFNTSSAFNTPSAFNASSGGSLGTLQQSAFETVGGNAGFIGGSQNTGIGGGNQGAALGGTNSQNGGLGGANSQNAGFGQQAGARLTTSAFHKQVTPAGSSTTFAPAFQGSSSGSAFGIHTSTPAAVSTPASAFSSTPVTSQGLSTSTFSSTPIASQGQTTLAFGKGGYASAASPSQSNSVFAVPTSRPSASQSTSRPSQQVSTPPAKTPLLTDASTSRQDSNSTEDADSRAARFSAVPIGNRHEELKEMRKLERQDAIRRGTIPDPDKPRRLEDAISFFGTCMDMCPEYERHEREFQQNVERFEKIPGTESIDHARAVKAYARPAAGADQPLPSDVRPPKALLSTLDYLINHIVSEGDLADSHAFVRDRTRSIRQDFTLQNNRGMEAITAHETIARYHILCMHQLCENKNFSDQQEMEQLRKVLTSLQEFYEDMRAEGVPCPNEAEFRAYHILSHLRDPDMIRQAQQLPFHIFQDPYIQVAAEIHALTRRNNDLKRRAKVQSEASPNFFSRFFKLVAGPSTTYLMACLLETKFVEIRKGALKTLNKCYLDRHTGFPVEDLVTILGFDDAEECIANCDEYELPMSTPDLASVIFGKKDASRRHIFKENTLALKQHRNLRIVEAKRQNYTAAQIIYGDTPGPQKISAVSGMTQPAVRPTYRPAAVKPLQGLTTARASSSSNLQAPGSSAFVNPSTAAARTSQPAAGVNPSSGMFDFGLGVSSAPTPNGVTASTASAQGSLLPSVFSAAAGTLGAAAGTPLVSQAFNNGTTLSSVVLPSFGQQSLSTATNNTIQMPATLLSNTTTAGIKPPGFTFSAPPATSATYSTTSAFAPTPPSAASSSTGTPTQLPLFTAAPFALSAPSQTPPSSTPSSSFTHTPTLSGIYTSTSRAPGIINISTPPATTAAQPPTPTRSSLFNTPPPLSPSLTPKSDATRIVTKRGRIYPRSIVESIVKTLLDAETDRLIRMTAAQMSQELVVERSVRRAKARQDTVQRETMRIMDEVMAQVASETVEDILADIYRETNVQRRIVTQWRSFAAKSIQRSEELRRRQDHFLSNVRAMGSRAGLTDAEPWTVKIREQNSARRLPRNGSNKGRSDSDMQEIKAMAASNKRKRLLSIGQEGSPDLALVAGLKKAAAPKQEMWAPLPVLEIVESRYNKTSAAVNEDSASSDLQPARRTGGLTKRRWRLFVGSPSLKDATSKWLLRKLGVDMSRTTKTQQRSGTMVAEHLGRKDSETAMDVIVHGSEDASVMELLGMSKYEIMETAAFIFEFSKIPFADNEATNQAIRQYWQSERSRLVRFLSCFPKVKQPIVFILWTSSPEVWERMSPRMEEYLELDAMVKSPKAPLLAYRFLNMDMAAMKLDRFVTGSLEWLATETKDYFEDPAAMLRSLLEKYRPIYDWALCRVSLAQGPCYSQYDEEDEEEANMWLLKQNQRRKQQEQLLLVNGAGASGAEIRDSDDLAPPVNLFVESVETGFNLAVRLFNLELENISQTIEAKGKGETREGAAQEGRVKDAMARFIRQAELPEMKPRSILDRIHFGMDSKSAFCDFLDVYIATLGGLFKEPQNLEAKSAMRTEIWKLLRSSTEDRVPLEAIFKRISSQVMTWIEAGILDTERFSIRLKKWESLRDSLERQQDQYRLQQQQLDTVDWEDENDSDPNHNGRTGGPQGGSSSMSFTPLLIHDEVDIDENVFDFETTAQSEVRIWERAIEKRAREREERILAVPVETTSLAHRAGLTAPSAFALGTNRFGDSRKRRAPESPRETLKKSRMLARSGLGPNNDENLFLASSSVSRPSSPPNGAAAYSTSGTSNNGSPSPGLHSATRPWSLPLSKTVSPSSASGTHTPSSTPPATTPIASATGTTSASSPGVDRLARLRSLIKEVKATTHLPPRP